MSQFEIVSDFKMTGDQPRVWERVGGIILEGGIRNDIYPRPNLPDQFHPLHRNTGLGLSGLLQKQE